MGRFRTRFQFNV